MVNYFDICDSSLKAQRVFSGYSTIKERAKNSLKVKFGIRDKDRGFNENNVFV